MTPELKTQIEAALEEIDALNKHRYTGTSAGMTDLTYAFDACHKALAALRAEPESEPVAYQYQARDGSWQPFLNEKHFDDTKADGSWPIRALYTTPQSAPLTDAQISLMAHNEDAGDWNDLRYRDCWHKGYMAGARAIEAAHGIKPKE